MPWPKWVPDLSRASSLVPHSIRHRSRQIRLHCERRCLQRRGELRLAPEGLLRQRRESSNQHQHQQDEDAARDSKHSAERAVGEAEARRPNELGDEQAGHTRADEHQEHQRRKNDQGPHERRGKTRGKEARGLSGEQGCDRDRRDPPGKREHFAYEPARNTDDSGQHKYGEDGVVEPGHWFWRAATGPGSRPSDLSWSRVLSAAVLLSNGPARTRVRWPFAVKSDSV